VPGEINLKKLELMVATDTTYTTNIVIAARFFFDSFEFRLSTNFFISI